MEQDPGQGRDSGGVAADTAFEKRIGRRHPIDKLPIGWRVDRPLKGSRRRPRGHEKGVLLDLSMSGIRVEAPTSREVQVGHRVMVEIEGLIGHMRVRRIAESPAKGQSIYGLEFLDGTADMARRVHYKLIGQYEPEEEVEEENELDDLFADLLYGQPNGWGSRPTPNYDAYPRVDGKPPRLSNS